MYIDGMILKNAVERKGFIDESNVFSNIKEVFKNGFYFDYL